MVEQTPVQQSGSLEFAQPHEWRRYLRAAALGGVAIIGSFSAANYKMDSAVAGTPIAAANPKVSEAPASQTVSLIMPKFGIRDSCVWACPGTPTNANYTPASGVADIEAIGFEEVNITQEINQTLTGIAPTTCEANDPALNFTVVDEAVRSITPTGAELTIDFDDHKLPSYPNYILRCMARGFALRYSGNYPDPLYPGQVLGAVNNTELGNEVNLKRNYKGSVRRFVSQYLAWRDGVRSVNPKASIAGAVLAGTAPYSPIDYTKDYSDEYKKQAIGEPPPDMFDIHAYPAANEIDTPYYTLSNATTTVNGRVYNRVGDISIANLADYRQALNDDFGDGQDTRPKVDIVVGETAWFKNGDTNNGIIGVNEATQAKYYDQMYKKLIKDAQDPVTNIGLRYVNWFQLLSGVKWQWRSGPVSMSGVNKDGSTLTRSKLYYTMQKDQHSSSQTGS